MRADVHDLYGVPARTHPRHPQRHRPRPVPPHARPGRAGPLRHRPGAALRAVRRPDHPPEGHHPPRPRPALLAARASRWSSAPARPDTPEIGREMAEAVEQARRQTANPILWVAADGAREDMIAAVHAGGRLRLPVGVRAVRHHQPGGDGVRHAGGGLGGGRHQGGGRARRDGPAGAARGARRDRLRAARPRPLRPRPCRRDQLACWPTRGGARRWAAGRGERVEEHFSWASVARRTLEFYADRVAARRGDAS